MGKRVAGICDVCPSDDGFTKKRDGFFYCVWCNSQAEDIRDAGIDEDGFYSSRFARARPSRPPAAATEPVSQVKSAMSQHLDRSHLVDNTGEDIIEPNEPRDFATSLKDYTLDDYYTDIRSRYLKGLQLMMQLQSQALVEKFGVSPLIVGLVGPLWFRYLASTKVLADGWAHRAVHDSETQVQGEEDEFQPSLKSPWEEPVNIFGKRLAYIWYKSLKVALPIPCSLAISLLVCHLAREPILPTDILKWAHEGKLPYISAYIAIEKQLGSCTQTCPITARRMFRPVVVVSSQKLEAMAAGIAREIGLKLPPVNFYSIVSRYLRKLSLPTEKLLPSACHIYEWSMPSELYLSANEARIPTRAYVMSILIIAIRKHFDINGYGVWESSLSNPSSSSSRVKNGDSESWSHLNETETADDVSSSHDVKPSGTKDRDLSAMELLQILDAKYHELSNNTYEYSRDLATYLQYCKDVVFSRPSFEDAEDEKLIDELWAIYQKNKGAQTPDENEKSSDDLEKKEDEARNRGSQSRCSTSRKSGDSDSEDDCSKCSTDRLNCCHREQDSAYSSRIPIGSAKEKALKLLKLDMEENHFCYRPPRKSIRCRDYVHYSRKRQGVFIYAVHADYYLLVRCCAKVAEVEIRIMHTAVLRIERRLNWLEHRIDRSLFCHSNPGSGCEFCEGDAKDAGNDTDYSNIS
ncbi:TATA box-binding protein-associated factor RNA polymerase I subunit B isoform X1 [Salvia hispanica]|uniref:TATA box-binding protein-associated factor RNA polymerase I subunit B isoform X1 n=1 Tax=Salvia hispanica TaxID=49212 RepID=UPI002009A9FF|nr:TATA box-binding protein-associated factor RNA polymerase I subunit B isoform X1 [Salvia hispanica]